MKFKDLLSEYNIPIGSTGERHVRSGWIQFDCPYCSLDTQGWYMGYSIEGNFLNCWRCGFHPLIKTLMLLTGLSYEKIKDKLDDLETEYFKTKKAIGILVIPKGIKQLHSAHKKYLLNRKFDWKKIEQVWSIKGIAIASRLSWRIWIPIHYHGKIVSWTTRSISDNFNNRYISAGLNEESIPHKELLYGEDFVRHAIIINEGPMDTWRIGPGAVSTFGLGFSRKQVEKIAKYPIRAICFDNEPGAQRKAKILINDLSVFPGETFNVILDAKDAAEESAENIKRLRREILE